MTPPPLRAPAACVAACNVQASWSAPPILVLLLTPATFAVGWWLHSGHPVQVGGLPPPHSVAGGWQGRGPILLTGFCSHSGTRPQRILHYHHLRVSPGVRGILPSGNPDGPMPPLAS